MRASLKGQQSLVELARMEANDLVETFAATLVRQGQGAGAERRGGRGARDMEGGEEDGGEEGEHFGQIVNELREELRIQESIESRLRKSYGSGSRGKV